MRSLFDDLYRLRAFCNSVLINSEMEREGRFEMVDGVCGYQNTKDAIGHKVRIGGLDELEN